MRVLVTGGSGFIGSNLVDVLLSEGHAVTAVDNLSTGRARFLEDARRHPRFTFIELDLLGSDDALGDVMDGLDAVAHLAANADGRFGWTDPARDLNQNVIATHRVLEAARRAQVPRFLFASSGMVYGEAPIIPTPEHCPFPVQTSLYGASKLAAEGFVQAYAEGTGMRATIVRFVSVLGARYTHGHVIDFVRGLRRDPTRLSILGDGTQRKSYVEITDCVAAISRLIVDDSLVGTFNVGLEDSCTVRESVAWICDRLGVSPQLRFEGGPRGWVGDNPYVQLAVDRLLATGWEPKFTIRQAVERTVDWLTAQDWLIDELDPRRAR